MAKIKKLLIANRGEIAVRIIRACRKLGITSVVIYSEIDQNAMHVREADEAMLVGPAPASASYLNIPAIIAAAQMAGADAVHPGYGFLSERANFAQAVIDAGLIWVGPSPQAINMLGDKISAKRLMDDAGVPTVPGFYDAEQRQQDPAKLQQEARRIGFPLLIKAASGGGGKGMRLVEQEAEFTAALEGASREAEAAFGDPTVFLERYIKHPRHIEFQIIGDSQGNVLHLGERECSIQRRHQKVLEEAPSPAPQMTTEKRAAMGAAAVAAGKAAGYSNAGTVEFIMDMAGNYYFLEMNTRLQVEHPVTEQVTRVPMREGQEPEQLDLVELQIRVAEGESLPFQQDQVQRHGHAIEVRVYAENAGADFLPSIGTLDRFDPPTTPGTRNDVGVAAGDQVSVYYDPMLAKLICFGDNRAAALLNLVRALTQYDVAGVITNIDFLYWLANQPDVTTGNFDTGFITEHFDPAQLGAEQAPQLVVLAVAGHEVFNATSDNQPYNPWQDKQLTMNTQPSRLSYNYLAPGKADRAESVLVTYSKRGDQIKATCNDVSAVIRKGKLGGVVEICPIDDSSKDIFTVTSGANAPDILIVSDERRYYRFQIPPALSTDTLQVAPQLTAENKLEAPMPGKIIETLVEKGQQVSAGERLVVMEAMKMEFTVRAPFDGTVQQLLVSKGQIVQAGAVLVEMQER